MSHICRLQLPKINTGSDFGSDIKVELVSARRITTTHNPWKQITSICLFVIGPHAVTFEPWWIGLSIILVPLL